MSLERPEGAVETARYLGWRVFMAFPAVMEACGGDPDAIEPAVLEELGAVVLDRERKLAATVACELAPLIGLGAEMKALRLA